MTETTKAAGNRGKGRKPGQLNKNTAALKNAILLAAEDVGSDGKGKGGLRGYLRGLARHEPKAFAGLLGKVLPMQVIGDPENPLHAIARIELVGVRPD